MKILFDTNVLFAATVSNGLCAEAYFKAVRSCEIFTSEPLLEELTSKLAEKARFTRIESSEVADEIRDIAQIVEPTELPRRVCRDADDDVVLATAIAASADCIVTGDQDLLVLRNYDGIEIITPRQFVERLES